MVTGHHAHDAMGSVGARPSEDASALADGSVRDLREAYPKLVCQFESKAGVAQIGTIAPVVDA